MSWRDRMGPAKFRGVPFFVETSERGGGRRGVTHEYPFREVPFREDIGRKARTFPIEGYVVGENYFAARDALISALEAAGPGELVHPYHGTLRVAVVDFRVRESAADGGMAVFSVDFVETSAQPVQPTAAPDTASKVRTSAAAARAAVQTEFLARYVPGALHTSITGALTSLSGAVDKLLTYSLMEKDSLASMKVQSAAFSSGISALVNVASDMFDTTANLFDGLDGGLLDLYRFDPGVRPPATTSRRVQEQANFDAVQRMVQRLAVIRAAELALDATYDSYDAAVAARDALTVCLDEQADVAADDTYPSLLQLRADLVKAIPGENTDLPRLLAYTPQDTVPSLVLAHLLYGDVTLEADLLARNRVRHPGFVMGGQPLEVLSRG
jgi:prophage DNA circulation protein